MRVGEFYNVRNIEKMCESFLVVIDTNFMINEIVKYLDDRNLEVGVSGVYNWANEYYNKYATDDEKKKYEEALLKRDEIIELYKELAADIANLKEKGNNLQAIAKKLDLDQFFIVELYYMNACKHLYKRNLNNISISLNNYEKKVLNKYIFYSYINSNLSSYCCKKKIKDFLNVEINDISWEILLKNCLKNLTEQEEQILTKIRNKRSRNEEVSLEKKQVIDNMANNVYMIIYNKDFFKQRITHSSLLYEDYKYVVEKLSHCNDEEIYKKLLESVKEANYPLEICEIIGDEELINQAKTVIEEDRRNKEIQYQQQKNIVEQQKKERILLFKNIDLLKLQQLIKEEVGLNVEFEEMSASEAARYIHEKHSSTYYWFKENFSYLMLNENDDFITYIKEIINNLNEQRKQEELETKKIEKELRELKKQKELEKKKLKQDLKEQKLLAEKQKKEDLEKRNKECLEEAKTKLLKLINSELSIEEYCYANNIKFEELDELSKYINKQIKSISNTDVKREFEQLISQYDLLKKEKGNKKRKQSYTAIISNIQKMIIYINKDYSKMKPEMVQYLQQEDFSLLDLFSITTLVPDELYKIVKESKYLTEEEKKIFSKFLLESGIVNFVDGKKRIRNYYISTNDIYNDKNIIKGHEVTKEEKQAILQFLESKNIPLYNRIYMNALRRYLDGTLIDRYNAIKSNDYIKNDIEILEDNTNNIKK